MSKSQKSYWLKSGLLSFLEKGSVFIFGFGGFFLLTKYFIGQFGEEAGKEQIGIWVIFYTIVSFIEVGRAGLLQNALVKFLSDSEEDKHPLINTASLAINGILTIAFIIFLLVFAFPVGELFAPQLTNMLFVYCFTVVLMIPFNQFNFIQIANLDFRGPFWSNFTKQGLFFLFILGAVIFKWEITLFLLVIAQAVATTVAVLVNAFFARPYLKFSKEISKEWMLKLFNFGRFVFGTNISTMVYKRIDTLMLGSIMLPTHAGVYEWPIKITNLTEVPTFSIANIVFPQAAKMSKSNTKKELKELYEKSVGAILALNGPFIVFVFFFASFIISFLAGPEYSESIPVLQLTILFGLFIPFAVLFGTILDAMGKPKINFYFTIVGSIINIISNYLFITNFGVMGAAYGTLTSYTVTFIGMQYVLYRLLNVKAYKAFFYIPGFYKQGLDLARNFLVKNKEVPEAEVLDDGFVTKP